MIIVVDFGSQYSHLITKRIRELGEFAELIQPQVLKEYVAQPVVKGIVLVGGPESVYAEDTPDLDIRFLRKCKPILGICPNIREESSGT